MTTVKPSAHRVKLLSEIVFAIKRYPDAKPTSKYVGDILLAISLTEEENETNQ